MSRADACIHEQEVLDLVAIGQWPVRADDALRAHVSTCAVCADLAAVASVVGDLGDAARMEARLPDASSVWYRAQVKAREDLARRAARPLMIADLAAAAGGLAVVALTWTFGGAWLKEMAAGLWASTTNIGPGLVRDAESVAGAWRWIWMILVAWAALIPGAFYLARIADRATESPSERRTHV